MAQRLQQAVREADLVAHANDEQPLAARLGGDEFAILLDGIKADADAARVAERLLKALENPYLIEGHEVHSTASIGITTNSLGYNSPEEMIRDADTAMYRAKSHGGSRFVMFDQAMHNNAVERLELENDLRHAVERGQICLFYQPIVNMRTRQLAGFEALARWNHAKRGLIGPTEFISLAEETGIIVPLGIWILEQACKQLAEWQQNHPEIATITMSVNLSRKQLAMPDLLPRIRQILADTGVNPRFLKLEITESTMMQDADAALAVLKQIQAMNIQLHMDDFGTGYSSLSCLQQFPLDGLKIDRQFVSGIATRADHAAVLRAIVQLAHNLKIPLVAEGIETLDQIKVLDSLGCDQAQGFFFARPMDTESATKFIKEQNTKTDAA
jgi:predicted signal transduction protein with EAL and GGDEF domain